VLQAVFSVFRASLIATQLCGEQISAAVNQHSTIEEAMFSVGAIPRLYNEDLTKLEWELSSVPELAVAAENWQGRQSKVIEKKCEEMN
jgi:hypothetical protein